MFRKVAPFIVKHSYVKNEYDSASSNAFGVQITTKDVIGDVLYYDNCGNLSDRPTPNVSVKTIYSDIPTSELIPFAE